MYSVELQNLIKNLLHLEPSQQPLTPKDVLQIDFVNEFFAEQEAVDKFFGKSLEEYKKLYREVRPLGEGGQGAVILV